MWVCADDMGCVHVLFLIGSDLRVWHVVGLCGFCVAGCGFCVGSAG